MTELFDPYLKKKKTSHLKLVVSSPSPSQEQSSTQPAPASTEFTAVTQMKNPSHYVLVAYDHFHHLECALPLEIHDEEDQDELEPKSVVCYFPDILTEELNDFIEEDETLLGMILIQFQMKLLEQLPLFCDVHNSLNLIIYATDTSEGHALGIYENLVAYDDKAPAIYKIPTIAGTKTQMVIPITQKTFDKLAKLIAQVNQDFRQILWKDQRTNPSIRAYLKSSPYLGTFG